MIHNEKERKNEKIARECPDASRFVITYTELPLRKSEGFFARSLTCLSVERVGRYSVYRCQTKSVCISSMKKFTAKLNRRWKETPRKVSTEFFRRNFVHCHLKSSFAELLYLHPNDHTTNLFQICQQTFFIVSNGRNCQHYLSFCLSQQVFLL